MVTAVKRANVGQGKADTIVKVPPNAGRLIQALREMGYDSFASILDIVDNSIDAQASKIWITVKEVSKGNLVIDIQDNGIGMDRPTLEQALRLGSDVKHDVEVDLGKFGMGLVTASIGLAKNVWIITRKDKGQGFEATFDIGMIERHNDFVIHCSESKGGKAFEILGDRGTLVRLSQIDRIDDTNPSRFATALRDKIGQVYRGFISKGLTIAVNNRRVDATDPLMRQHEMTRILLDQDLNLGAGKKAHLTVAQLPELGPAGDEEYNIRPRNAGFYIVRNGREIMEAQTFGFDGLAARHHGYSRFRAELAFDGTLDQDFHVDIKKSIIHPNDIVRDKIYEKTKPLIADVGRAGRETTEPLRLTPKSTEDAINAAINGPTPQPPAPTLVQGKKPDSPAKLDIIDADKKPPAPVKAVEFSSEDAGEKARFFAVEHKSGCPMLIKLNRQHALVRAVEGKSKPGTILAYIVTAMARAEADTKDGHKFVEKVCSELTQLLTAPAVQQ